MKPRFDAERAADGSYVINVLAAEREPRDWPAIAFMTVAGVGLVAMLVGAARWLFGW